SVALAISLPLLAITSFESDPVIAVIVRTFAAAALAIAVTMLVLLAARTENGDLASRRNTVRGITISLLIATILPNIYVAARCRDDAKVLDELLAQSRFGEA